jgi:hypothetical protein
MGQLCHCRLWQVSQYTCIMGAGLLSWCMHHTMQVYVVHHRARHMGDGGMFVLAACDATCNLYSSHPSRRFT